MTRGDAVFQRLGRVALICGVGIGIGLLQWSRAKEVGAPPPLPDVSGRALAERHCIACHVLPEPDQLPKHSWPFVMRWMGRYFGHARLSASFDRITVRTQVPQLPLVHAAVLDRIRGYYVHNAPTREVFSPRRDPAPPLRGYAARPLLEGVGNGVIVTLLHVDPRRGHLYVGTRSDQKLRIYDRSLELRVEIALDGEPMHLAPRNRGFRLTTVGNFGWYRDSARIVEYDFADDEWNGLRRRALAIGLHRSAESHEADLDGDGRPDLVVVSPGHGHGAGYGKVSVLWASATSRARIEAADSLFHTAHGSLLPGAFDEQVLLDRAGGLAAQIADVDEDGRADVLVLAGGGDQELIAYLGRGGQRFERRVIARRHPSWGYAAFAATDVDGDGHVDLVIANGEDQAMKNPVPRPYHGVRFLRGDGKLGFREQLFYPMYGASGIVVADLDGDGDRDIAAIAMYPDWSARPPETFTVLENQGDQTFEPRTLLGPEWGRWLRIASGDLAGDGEIEVFLGNGNLHGAGVHPDLPHEWKPWGRRIAGRPGVLVLDPSAGQ